MDNMDLQIRCHKKAKEIIDRHFGDLIHEAAYERPEVLDEKYTKELPFAIEDEFLAFLDGLKIELFPGDSRPIEDLIDRPLKREMIREDYDSDVDKAYKDAATITFWEKITKSNHEDVTYYKGLLKQYSEELLEHMTNDFLNLGEAL